MRDTFFEPSNCQRCGSEEARRMFTASWFTNAKICMKCSEKEDEIMNKIEKQLGMNVRKRYEGCGYVPKV